MDQQDDSDPFAALRQWAEETERRVRREGTWLRMRRRVSLLAPVIIAGLLLVSLVPAVRSRLPSGARPATSAATGGDREDVLPAESVEAVTPASAAPSDPFAGTPAARYPKGAAGIKLPAATAVAGFTAGQVGTALRQVRAALIAGRLAPDMLVGHHPEPFLALLAPNDRGPVGKWFTTADFDTVATWIAPGVRLDPAEQPRVSGRVSYSSVDIDGIATLRVTTNFVWVYAFTGADHPLAAEHDEIRWQFPSTRHLRAGDRGMFVAGAKAYAALVDCAAAAKGLLAPTGGGTATAGVPQEDPDEYLDAGHTLDITDECG